MAGGSKYSSSLGMLLTIYSGMILFTTQNILAFSSNTGSTRQKSLGMDTRKRWTRTRLLALGATRNPTRFAAATRNHHANRGVASLSMRDRSSSYWFSVGDQVQVVEDVYTKNENLKGKLGRVVETWEKCDVDPTCCCAEQVDTDMAVRVLFEENGKDGDDRKNSDKDIIDLAAFYYYFAEEELTKV